MVNIYELKLTVLQERILRLLFVKAGESLNMNRIAKILHVSQAAVQKSIPHLEKSEYIHAIQDSDSSRWAITLKRDDKNIIGLKRADNIKQLYESGFVREIYDKYPAATVIVFGSYSQGEDTYNSDIDIAVFGSENKEIDLKFEKILERNIIINHYPSFRIKDKNLLNNILNGITIKGVVEIDEKL